MDYTKGTHRGFCFVEYQEPDDAEEAIYNLDGAELLGRVLKVSMAQPNQASKLSQGASMNEAIWKSDEWFQQQVSDQADQAKEQLKEQDAKALR